MPGDFLVNLMPILLMSVGFGIIAYKLAVEKGRNTALWATLGSVPFLNFICMPYFIGAANYRLERKLDELNKRLGIQN